MGKLLTNLREKLNKANDYLPIIEVFIKNIGFKLLYNN